MLREGTIMSIQSPYASPVILCRKNNGLPPDNLEAYRFSVDYRKLNAITRYPRYPLPLIEDLITNISHTTIMSSLDLRSGRLQLAVNPSDLVKTDFATKTSLMRLSACSLASRELPRIFRPLGSCNRYNTQTGIREEAGLTLNKDKCNFSCEKLNYLGLVISKDGITTDESKVKPMIEMKIPKNAKEVSKFLGMPQWYQKFIKGYADFCKRLYQLKKKYKKFIWSEKTQVTFQSIQRTVSEAPVLRLPDSNVPFELFTEPSLIWIGALLTQDQRPIAYASRTLNNAERNYTVTERECLAVIWALNKFRTYFGPLPVKVITDHETH
ncbi:retrovirus-related Pol polyprotein from transposon 17.6 [Trichonephila clavipes]|nr:retrovirus-related Pol polyprotein from transposon 17.6 [Trichonephila clavipes]